MRKRDNVSITNVVFSGTLQPRANAVCTAAPSNMTGGGNLTVTNSTFTGNVAAKNAGNGSGGAIYFDNGGDPGNVSITNSTFTNNIAQVLAAGAAPSFLAGGTARFMA